MIYRPAESRDIPQIMEVRLAVKENILSDPSLITAEDYATFMQERGKGWVCEREGKILGFANVDMVDHNVWALFIRPEAAQQGIGKRLHQIMMDAYFAETQETIWLGTDPGTRAATFYKKQGWTQTGVRDNGELRFEMTHADWLALTTP